MEMYLESVEYSNSFPLWEKTIKATSASQRTEISWAFLSNPVLLLEKVTCLLILFSMRFNCTFPLPMDSLSLSLLLLFFFLSLISFFFYLSVEPRRTKQLLQFTEDLKKETLKLLSSPRFLKENQNCAWSKRKEW